MTDKTGANPAAADFSTGFSMAFDKVESWIDGFYALIPNMVVGFAILFFFGLFSYSISRAIRRYFTSRQRADLGHILSDFGFWGFMTFGFLVFLTIIVPSLKSSDLLASLGIGSLAVGFAFKDILQNWMAGLLILLRLPFRRGDQIKVQDAEGTVLRIEPRATIIRTYDGRDIVVPNTTIYTNMVTIHTSQETRRIELDLTVGYAYDIRLITDIIKNALAQVEEIQKDPEPQILCWDLGPTSLAIKMRWWIDSERAGEVISRARAVQAIKEAFDANDIDPTDPQLVFYQQTGGQGAARPETRHSGPNLAGPDAFYGPPPKLTVSASDPEAEQPKIDPKEKTLLPQG